MECITSEQIKSIPMAVSQTNEVYKENKGNYLHVLLEEKDHYFNRP